MGSQRAFTMLETIAALGIVTILLLAGLRMATLGRAPGATADAAAQLDAAIALSRSLARASGNGATLLALPRTDTGGRAMVGFRIVLYRGRPNAPGAATLARSLPLVADATLEEGSVGAPPFALFFRGDGSAVALAHPSLGGSAAAPQLATIAAEPPCLSSAGVVLRVTRNGATVTRSIPCPAVAGGGVSAPQASMTPNPPTLAPRALRFTWPSAPVQEFAIAEFGYRGWFAATGGAMQSFSCRANGAAVVAFSNSPPYSGPQSLADARSFPSPPNGVPYAFAASASAAAGAMDDAPALFPVQPVTAGLCAVPLVDAFGQRSDPWGNPLVVAMQVMGWLTLTANGGSATHNTAPLAINSTPLASGQSVRVDASKTFDNDPAGIAFAGLSWSPASCGSALTLTASGNNTAGSSPTGTATHSFIITDSTPPSTALTCTGTITDQYGEPTVAFTTTVAAGASAMLTWPAGGIVEAASGSTLAMLPLHEPLIAQLFGAEIADALTTGCKAVAIQSGTYPQDAQGNPFTPATITGLQANGQPLPAAVQSLLSGQGYSVDSTGCVLQNGAKAAQAPIVAYEPRDSSASTPTYQGTAPLGCKNIASLGQAYPMSQMGGEVLFPVLPGSNAGSCTVAIVASPAPSGTPAPGSGLVPVGVIAGPACTSPVNGPTDGASYCLWFDPQGVGTACGALVPTPCGVWQTYYYAPAANVPNTTSSWGAIAYCQVEESGGIPMYAPKTMANAAGFSCANLPPTSPVTSLPGGATPTPGPKSTPPIKLPPP